MPSSQLDHSPIQTTGIDKTADWYVETLGIEFDQRQVSDQGLYQLFPIDPNGVKIELNFANEEPRV